MIRENFTGNRGGLESARNWKQLNGRFHSGQNMRRRKEEPSVWEPAPAPGVLRPDSWEPIRRITLEETAHELLLMRSGSLIGACVGQNWHDADIDGEVVEIGSVEGEIIGVERVAQGIWKLLRRLKSPVYFTVAPDSASTCGLRFSLPGEMPALPWLSVTDTDAQTLTEPLSAIALGKASLPTDNHLTPGDARRLTSSLTACYSRLEAKARRMGLYLQPTLARYRIETPSGDTLVCGPTVMVGATHGFQCTGAVTLYSDDSFATLRGGALTAKAYNLRVHVPQGVAAPWNRIAARLVVETLAPLDPFDMLATADTRITTLATGSAPGAPSSGLPAVETYMPGITSVAAENLSRQRSLVRDALADAPGQWRVQAVIQNPFGTEQQEDAGDNSLPALPSLPSAPSFPSIPGIPSLSPSTSSLPLNPAARLSGVGAPLVPVAGALSVGCLTNCEGLTIAAEINIDPCGIYPPQCYALSLSPYTASGSGTTSSPSGETTAVEWQAASSTLDTIGLTDSSAGYGSGGAPLSLSPLLCVPNGDAAYLTLSLTAPDGSARTERYRLTSLPGANMAYYLADDLRPIFPRTVASKVKVAEKTAWNRRYLGSLAVFNRGKWNTPLSLHLSDNPSMPGLPSLSFGHFAALAVAPRSRGSWDFSRLKVLAMGRSGTRLLTIGTAGQIKASALLDSRPIYTAQSVAPAVNASGWCLVAVAGDDIVEISNSGVKTVAPARGADYAAWCPRHREFWLSGSSTMRRLELASGFPEPVDAVYPSLGLSKPAKAAGFAPDGTFTVPDRPFSPRLIPWEGDLLIATGSALLSTALDPDDLPAPSRPQFQSADPAAEESADPVGTHTGASAGSTTDSLPNDSSLPALPFDPRPKIDCAIRLGHPALPRSADAYSTALQAVMVPLVGSSVKGNLTIGSHRGSGTPDIQASLEIDGPVNSPLHLAIDTPPREWLNLSFTGTLSEDASLRPLSALYTHT